MILITLADLLLLVLTAGLLGWVIFPALVLLFVINYWILRAFCKGTKAEGVVKNRLEQDPEDGVPMTDADPNDDPSENLGKDTTEEETKEFIALAALSSIWIPSVVGQQSQRIFLVSGIVSLVTKVLLLAVAVTLAASGLQPHVYKRPFLLFCFDESSIPLNEADVKQCSLSEENCFGRPEMTREKEFSTALEQVENKWVARFDNASALLDQIKDLKEKVDEELRSAGIGRVQQKIRICEDDKTELHLRLGLLSGLLVVVALAVFATYRLHKIADYQVQK